MSRPRVDGKFLFAGDQKLYVRGVTYGTFRPDAHGSDYPSPEVVRGDLAAMASAGVNAVRTYTVPPRWLLDEAQERGIRVMVGLPWEQHITFLDDRATARGIERRVREGVRSLAGHPALLAYTVGNEIPAPIVRWHGRARVERYLRRLHEAAKDEDPEGLVTYVNYPSTEYLELPFVDFLSFNVYLEAERTLEAYLARLQSLAGDRPLVMAEIGLDSRRHGEQAQAHALGWQVRTAFRAGCAGAFVFSWTDEWHRGGHDIDDWDFGLVDRDRRPKAALSSVAHAFADVPLPLDTDWPSMSVVVCTYNGAATLDGCLAALGSLEYPDYEVVVVDDGSTDETAAIAERHDVRLIRTENRGLSSARNTGVEAATGDIVAFTDDDAEPDRHWLTYLAASFLDEARAAVGGPNVPPAESGRVAECVANAPGGPVHVLLSDREAEHIPGVNSAYRKAALQAIGGFDPRFRAAGDDVDVCWRLLERGWTIGFSPAAMVWHHNRDSISAYWRHQVGYGRAEALLEAKWPEKYNSLGHLTWAGRMYARSAIQRLTRRGERVRYGTWGSAAFQRLYQPAEGLAASLPLMPEWYLMIAVLAVLCGLGTLWAPLLAALPLLALSVAAPVAKAILSASRARFRSPAPTRSAELQRRATTALLYLMQPAARLRGRIGAGLTPWRRRGTGPMAWPWPTRVDVWSETWRPPEAWLSGVERRVRALGATVLRGGEFDPWDLELRAGLLGSARCLMTVEEHGGGRQMLRFRLRPRASRLGIVVVVLATALGVAAASDGAWVAAAMLALLALAVAVETARECGVSTGTLRTATQPEPEAQPAEEAAAVRALGQAA